jgi:hypothetical protein
VPRTGDEGVLLHTLEDHNGDADPGNLKLADDVAFAKIGRFFHNLLMAVSGVQVARYRAHLCALEFPRLDTADRCRHIWPCRRRRIERLHQAKRQMGRGVRTKVEASQDALGVGQVTDDFCEWARAVYAHD